MLGLWLLDVQSCLEKAREALQTVNSGDRAQGFTELERLFAVDFEWSSWLLVSDETMGQVVTVGAVGDGVGSRVPLHPSILPFLVMFEG